MWYHNFWFYNYRDPEIIDKIKHCAKRLEIGGISYVRTTRKERMETLSMDQLTGQFVQATLSRFWYGNFDEYFSYMDRHVGMGGDGGCDLEGLNIDVKGSLHKYHTSPMNYHLIVHPKEVHNNWIYVFGVYFPKESLVGLLGWVNTDQLRRYNQNPKFEGVYAVPIKKLNNLRDLKGNERHV